MDRRRFCLSSTALLVSTLLPVEKVFATTYLTPDEAKQVIWGDETMTSHNVTLTKAQMASIKKSSKTRVRHTALKAWKTESGGWFILDNVIGKHENIEIAVGLDYKGGVKGIEILIFRESYGDAVRNPKWRALLHGRDHTEILKLNKQIPNISGATLSCRHIVDGINRLTHTWDQVLRHL